MNNRTAALIVMISLAVAAGCSKQQAAAPAAAPGTSAGSPGASVGPEPGSQDIAGPVVETMDAGQYTYVKLNTSSGDVWAAALKFDVKVGDRVVVTPETPMRNFHSQTLNRDFPLIYFSSSIRKAGEPARGQAPAGAIAMAPSHGSAGAPPAPQGVIEPIAQPAGATSVADVWAQRKARAGKTVTVRGQVVKYHGAIMGRNWLHIQDGSGKAAEGTNDLTITSAQETKVGDVVTVTGTVAIDKDFTAGYAYAVMLENARIGK